MKDISVIILSFNTRDITLRCLHALHKSLSLSKSLRAQIVVIDNASVDGSQGVIEKFVESNTSTNITYDFIKNSENLGFVKGNNLGIEKSEGAYILFLNSDAIVEDVEFDELVKYMKNDRRIGALTVRIDLPNGGIDPASHRGFPTPWNSFCYFTGLEKLLGSLPYIGTYFGGYHLVNLPLNTIHEIDSPTGAFYMIKKSVIDEIGPFDRDYFMYGEDLDLSYRVKSRGYKIIYYPRYYATHLKYSSGLQTSNKKIKSNTRRFFYDAMKIFYKKHYSKKYPSLFNEFIYMVIDLKYKISN